MKTKASIVSIAAGVAAFLEAVALVSFAVAFLTWSGTKIAIVLNFPSFWIVARLPDVGVRLSFLSEMFVTVLIQYAFWFAVAYGVIRLYCRFTDYGKADTVE